MKTFARALALMLAALLAFGCLAACHGKDAVVATFDANGKTYSLTSGQYAYILLVADQEARTKVNEELTDAEKNAADNGTEIDVFSKTLDDKDYVTWVKDRAEELIREYFYVASEFDRLKLELSESDAGSMESYFAYMWQMYGRQYLCEPNGCSYDSFKAVQTVFIYERNALFEYLYGPDGPDPVSDEEKTAALEENYALADVITLDPSSLMEEAETTETEESEETEEVEQTEEEKAAEEAALKEQATAQLQGYANRINGGTDFSVIYYEYTGTTPPEETEDPDTSSAATTSEDPAEQTEELKAQDSLASVYSPDSGDDVDTSASTNLYYKVVDCEIGKATVVDTNDGKVALILRKDITADPYYAQQYEDNVLDILKGDTFDDTVSEGGKKLDVSVNDYERNHLDVKKIDYTKYNTYINSLYSQYYGS